MTDKVCELSLTQHCTRLAYGRVKNLRNHGRSKAYYAVDFQIHSLRFVPNFGTCFKNVCEICLVLRRNEKSIRSHTVKVNERTEEVKFNDELHQSVTLYLKNEDIESPQFCDKWYKAQLHEKNECGKILTLLDFNLVRAVSGGTKRLKLSKSLKYGKVEVQMLVENTLLSHDTNRVGGIVNQCKENPKKAQLRTTEVESMDNFDDLRISSAVISKKGSNEAGLSLPYSKGSQSCLGSNWSSRNNKNDNHHENYDKRSSEIIQGGNIARQITVNEANLSSQVSNQEEMRLNFYITEINSYLNHSELTEDEYKCFSKERLVSELLRSHAHSKKIVKLSQSLYEKYLKESEELLQQQILISNKCNVLQEKYDDVVKSQWKIKEFDKVLGENLSTREAMKITQVQNENLKYQLEKMKSQNSKIKKSSENN